MLAKETLIDLVGDLFKVLAQGSGDAREIGMIPKHSLFRNCEIQLCGFTVSTMDHLERVKGFLTNLFLAQKMITPGLLAKVDDGIQSQGITNPANHVAVPVLMARPSKITSDPWAPSSTCRLWCPAKA